MVRSATLTVLVAHALLPSSGPSQTIDTARVRAAYAAVTALRNDYERSHGRFVTVNGIRMHYLEWGEPNGVPLVWTHGSACSGYEIRAVAPRLVQAGAVSDWTFGQRRMGLSPGIRSHDGIV